MRKVEVAIIGAGTAGLSARREVAKKTNDYVVIDDGALGTTCARVGCMPSKVLIQVAEDFNRRFKLSKQGILGGDKLKVDPVAVMDHVRSLRDRFVGAVINDMKEWEADKLIRKRARFVGKNLLDLGDEKITAGKIIIATGSRPFIPNAYASYKDYFIDTDQVFELEVFPKNLVVLGLGVIGIELGQAFNRLGVRVLGVARSRNFGGITDPAIRDYALEQIGSELDCSFKGLEIIEEKNGRLRVQSGDREFMADKILLANGRRPNLDNLNIEAAGVTLDAQGVPRYLAHTYRIGETDIYIAGDVINEKMILHEASDEGRIAGYNAVNTEDTPYNRRVPMTVNFSSPIIASVGRTYKELKEERVDFVTGEVSYEGQGRAIVMLQECGLVHLYAHRQTGHFLGAELIAPHGDHLAHLLAWAIAKKATVREILSFPFYHPVLEEGIRTAFRDLSRKLQCQSPPLEMPLAERW